MMLEVMDMKKELEQLSNFDTSLYLNEIAKQNRKIFKVENAGRGNPNWVEVESRELYGIFYQFAIYASKQNHIDLLGGCASNNLYKTLQEYLNLDQDLHKRLYEFIMYTTISYNKTINQVLKEWVDAILGDYYPHPARCLESVEFVLKDYLSHYIIKQDALYHNLQVFPCEGGSAAICYIFQALKENFLLKANDKIALFTPIFTPYLELPILNDYEFVEVDLHAKEEDDYQISIQSLDILFDPSIKAIFMINPGNPTARAIHPNILARIKEILTIRSDLLIISDDVYASFSSDYQSIMKYAPNHTLFVYSFSKLYGATGWRIGCISATKDNVFDQQLQALSSEEKASLQERYHLITEDVSTFPFLERIVAESRYIAMYHTAGLATPNQLMMVFMALHSLLDTNNIYLEHTKDLIKERYQALYSALDLPCDLTLDDHTYYYALVNIYELAAKLYPSSFVDYIRQHIDSLDFAFDLAKDAAVVLISGPGFDAPEGTLRVSLANLNTPDYTTIGQQILSILKEEYLKCKELP